VHWFRARSWRIQTSLTWRTRSSRVLARDTSPRTADLYGALGDTRSSGVVLTDLTIAFGDVKEYRGGTIALVRGKTIALCEPGSIGKSTTIALAVWSIVSARNAARHHKGEANV